jgi:hypothetical protein
MPFLFVAEVVAAEVAAAAAAEAAAVAAAEIAATEAATVAAAEAAATQAAQATTAESLNLAAQQAAAQGANTQAGIMGAQAAGAGPTTTGIMAQAAPAAEAAVAVGGPGAGSAGTQAAMEASMQSAGATPGGIATVPQAAGSSAATTAGASPPGTYQMLSGETLNFGSSAPSGIVDATQSLQLPPGVTPSGAETAAGYTTAGPPPSALSKGWTAFSEFAKANPYTTAMGTYVVGNKLGLFDPNQQNFNSDPYNGPLNKYRLSSDFQGRQANPEDYQYTPRRYANGGIADVMQAPTNLNFVQAQQGMQSPAMPGGIASYKAGGSTSAVEYYTDMLGGERERQIAAMRTPAAGSRDVGIYRDADPDTRYLDPMSAAQVRMSKVNKRANVQTPGMKRPTPMGQLNLKPPGTKEGSSSPDVESAAQGGIMQASGHLGGYAAGGQPRLLKGPGDGMSDNIPATIANKQPARLADGEFVVPADVVSHLGNGSTNAGSKKLHGMMTNVRKARTGNPKQGKQINPNRFMPK